MRRLATVAAAAALTLTIAACGSGDDDPEVVPEGSTENTETNGTEEEGPEEEGTEEGPEEEGTEEEGTDESDGPDPEATGELPSYEEVKAIWMENTSDGDRSSCETGETEDNDIYSPNDGDYIRYLCNDFPRFDYVTGADNYADNFEAATRVLTGRAVFHIPGEAYVAPAGANKDMAVAIQQACGCGEVVGPEN